MTTRKIGLMAAVIFDIILINDKLVMVSLAAGRLFSGSV